MAYMRNEPRLRWKQKEIDIVTARAAQLRYENPALGKVEALLQAQIGNIEQTRLKKRFTTHFRIAMLKRLDAAEATYVPPAVEASAEAAAESTAVVEATQDFAPTIEDAPIATQDPAPIAAAAAAAPTTPESPMVTMCREFGAAFGAAIAGGIAPVLESAMSRVVQTLAQQLTLPPMLMQALAQPGHPASSLPMPPIGDVEVDDEHQQRDWGHLPEKFRTHKVAVIGLQQIQQNTIRQEFPHIDFRMLDNGANATQVRKVSAACEATVLMTKFISHHTQGGAPRDKRIMVNGGMSDLTRVLKHHFPRSTSIDVPPPREQHAAQHAAH